MARPVIDEVVADKPYHSNQVLVNVADQTFKSSNQLTSSTATMDSLRSAACCDEPSDLRGEPSR